MGRYAVSHAPHRVVTHRHLETGVATDDRIETVVTIRGHHDHLRAMMELRFDDACVTVNTRSATIGHGTHDDPMAINGEGDSAHLQIFLHEVPPLGRPISATIVAADGVHEILSQPAPIPPSRNIETELSRRPEGWVLQIVAKETIEVIEQRMYGIRYEEERHVLPPGRHHMPASAKFADTYGIAVSSHGIEGGEEHKHVILGHFAYPSGRVLLAFGAMHDPSCKDALAYRSGVVRFDAASDLSSIARHLDEIEVWAPLDLTTDAEMAISRLGMPARLRTYGPSSTPRPLDCVLLSPQDPPPSEGTFSYCLFADSDAPDYPARVGAALDVISGQAGNDHHLFESGWLRSSLSPDRFSHHYGIGFSTPSRTDAMRARIRNIRMCDLPNGILKDAQVAVRVENILPFPPPDTGSDDKSLEAIIATLLSSAA